ncbi:MAG: OmpA family protein [candidate division Zixibacteria bacterium]|nr:OmpA family protein [candidate division Zixibacteria bacterium]
MKTICAGFNSIALLAAVIVTLSGTSVSAHDYRFTLGARGGIVKIDGGKLFGFDDGRSLGGQLGLRLGNQWEIEFSYDQMQVDAVISDTLAFAPNSSLVSELFASRFGVTLQRFLLSYENRINLKLGIGAGLSDWEQTRAPDNSRLSVLSKNSQPTDFAASELFASASAGLDLHVTSFLSLGVSAQADYLTGAGADFESDFNSKRDRWIYSGLGQLNFHFGHRGPKQDEWKSDEAWKDKRETEKENNEKVIASQTKKPDKKSSQSQAPANRAASARDGDGDGVADETDTCLDTRWGTLVDKSGCPVDTDRDGIPDGLDDCPGTTSEAKSMVDIHGCPYDTDADGVADYGDNCVNSTLGSVVDENGCSVDSDGDGVSDGLDDCPGTLPNIQVDANGCIDLAVFAAPMVLHIDYLSGSFEIDPRSKERIKKLSGLLILVPTIKLEINGYTDDIGPEPANRQLSERRANRLRDYLITLGVAAERIKTFGRGESNFMASNQNANGRAKNRRIEIIFYK